MDCQEKLNLPSVSSSRKRRERYKGNGSIVPDEFARVLARLEVLEKVVLAKDVTVDLTESEPESEKYSREDLLQQRPFQDSDALKEVRKDKLSKSSPTSGVIGDPSPKFVANPGDQTSFKSVVEEFDVLIDALQDKLYSPVPVRESSASDPEDIDVVSEIAVPLGFCPRLQIDSTLSPVLDDDLDCEPYTAEVSAIANPLLIELPVKVDEIAESLWYLQHVGSMDTYEFEEWVYQREVSRLEEEYRGKPFLGTDEELSILADYGDVWNHFGDDDDDDLSFR